MGCPTRSRALLQVHIMVDRGRQLLQEKLAALAADLQISERPCTGLYPSCLWSSSTQALQSAM